MQNQPKNSEEQWTILKLLKWTTSYFQSHQIDSPRATAEILLAHTLEVKRIDLYLRYDQPLTRDELDRFRGLIRRRIQREPVAYIVGSKEFWSLDLAVTPDVLIPRPETECLVESVLALDRDGTPSSPKRILELGTGSGAIALALAFERSANVFYASDLSVRALAVARENARLLGLADRIHFFAGDWFGPLKDRTVAFDFIVSNPPYIAKSAMAQLQPEIRSFEPWLALNGDRDGLQSLRHIVAEAHRYLVPRGYVVVEIGHDQRAAMKDIIAACRHYDKVEFKQDYGGYDRVVVARKKERL